MSAAAGATAEYGCCSAVADETAEEASPFPFSFCCRREATPARKASIFVSIAEGASTTSAAALWRPMAISDEEESEAVSFPFFRSNTSSRNRV